MCEWQVGPEGWQRQGQGPCDRERWEGRRGEWRCYYLHVAGDDRGEGERGTTTMTTVSRRWKQGRERLGQARVEHAGGVEARIWGRKGGWCSGGHAATLEGSPGRPGSRGGSPERTWQQWSAKTALKSLLANLSTSRGVRWRGECSGGEVMSNRAMVDGDQRPWRTAERGAQLLAYTKEEKN
jgi:hypothetical protein